VNSPTGLYWKLTMPQCTVAPILHPGSLHVGPSIPWALKSHVHEEEKKEGDKKSSKSKSKKKHRRPLWKERHQLVWSNDTQAPNTRCYFGRPVEREDQPTIPRRRLRPVWRLDIPEEETPEKAYRIFDAANASWKEQPQWVMPDVLKLVLSGASPKAKAADSAPGSFGPRHVPAQDDDMQQSGNPLKEAAEEARKAAEASQKVGTPHAPGDLAFQRKRESGWDRKHTVLFSRDNDRLQVNMRSYFDRWKDVDDGSHEKEPTWRLRVERKPLIAKSASEPFLPKFQPQGGRYGPWNPVF